MLRKGSNLREREKTLRIRLGCAGPCDELRKAGSQQGHREFTLGRLMERRNQGTQLAFLELELVYEEYQRRALVEGSSAGGAK